MWSSSDPVYEEHCGAISCAVRHTHECFDFQKWAVAALLLSPSASSRWRLLKHHRCSPGCCASAITVGGGEETSWSLSSETGKLQRHHRRRCQPLLQSRMRRPATSVVHVQTPFPVDFSAYRKPQCCMVPGFFSCVWLCECCAVLFCTNLRARGHISAAFWAGQVDCPEVYFWNGLSQCCTCAVISCCNRWRPQRFGRGKKGVLATTCRYYRHNLNVELGQSVQNVGSSSGTWWLGLCSSTFTTKNCCKTATCFKGHFMARQVFQYWPATDLLQCDMALVEFGQAR